MKTYKQGVKDEQERILKIIDEMAKEHMFTEHLILINLKERIRGENESN